MSTWLKDTIERAVATAAEAALAVLGTGVFLDVTGVDWRYVLAVSAGGALLSVLKSLAARTMNDPDTASLVDLDPELPPALDG